MEINTAILRSKHYWGTLHSGWVCFQDPGKNPPNLQKAVLGGWKGVSKYKTGRISTEGYQSVFKCFQVIYSTCFIVSGISASSGSTQPFSSAR